MFTYSRTDPSTLFQFSHYTLQVSVCPCGNVDMRRLNPFIP